MNKVMLWVCEEYGVWTGEQAASASKNYAHCPMVVLIGTLNAVRR